MQRTESPAMTQHIKTWQDRLGNSAHIKSGGAVGEAMQAEIDELRAALAQPASAPAAVSGWKLVPVKPTQEMLDALWSYSEDSEGSYRAMLAAAPTGEPG